VIQCKCGHTANSNRAIQTY